MEITYRIGTRTSSLALKQVDEVLAAIRKYYPLIKTEVVGVTTYGDRDKITPISDIEGTDFFTCDIDDALLSGKIDFAVHSAKDLPCKLKDELTIVAVTKSVDPYDVLISKSGIKLNCFPPGAKIGTSSFRRKQELKKYRGDFVIVDIRGNIEERIEKLEKTDLDGIVIAAAGLIRLGLESKITQRISFKVLRPHTLQGSLAVVVREDDLRLTDLFSVIDSRRVKDHEG